MASFLLDERGWFLELPCIPPDFLVVLRKFHNGLLLHAFRMKSTDDLTPSLHVTAGRVQPIFSS